MGKVAAETGREVWLGRLNELVAAVKEWAEADGWSTRLTDKKYDDPDYGPDRVPALVLQRESVRLFLEPIGRSAPGAEAVVDLYVMPAYDDAATFLFTRGRWYVQFPLGRGKPSAATQANVLKVLNRLYADGR